MGFIKFLGTAGARFVMIRQLRSSGGIWLNWKSTNILIDPGPGAIVRVNSSRPKLDPSKLDAIILTHKHLDHSGDINVMIEAMTEGGFKKRGTLFVPSDAFGENNVVFKYAGNFPEKITLLSPGQFSIGDINFTVPVKNIHTQVETYGLRFDFDGKIVSFAGDSKYFDGLAKAHKGADILVLNVVFLEKRPGIDHLCLQEAIQLIKKIKPGKTILTHFGMSMLKAKPHILEEKLKEELKMDIVCARDGMSVEI